MFFQPMRELEFMDRFKLSPKNANKCYIGKQLPLLCETMTYFKPNKIISIEDKQIVSLLELGL